ncbi:amino acid aminotransferase [Streptomyces sp. NPDC054887]
MLELLSPPPTDPLFALVAELGAVARPERLDLLVGVYRDQSGTTPVMAAVREAELRLAERGESKEYRGLSGNRAFNRAMTSTVLGTDDLVSRATAIQTVAGTGALNLLAEFVHRTAPGATVWISDPSYVNHRPILESAGLTVRTYRYLDAEGRPDQAGLLRDLGEARRNDVVLIQGCCHNPTGVDLSAEAWDALTDLAAHHGWVPFVDLAYHGLGDGLEADLRPTRTMASRVEEMLIAVSCSKNFGLYSERTGCAIVLGPSRQALRHVESTLQNVARVLYSMPPEHGAAVVTTILDDPGLYTTWRVELDSMRTRINANRSDLVAHLDSLGCDRPARILAQQKGMFSMLPLTSEDMRRLREEFAVYGTGSGRINIAGVSAHRIPYLASSIAAVLDTSARPVPDARLAHH